MVKLTAGKEETKSGLSHLRPASQGARAAAAGGAARAATPSGLACLCLFSVYLMETANGDIKVNGRSSPKGWQGVVMTSQTDDFTVAYWDSARPNVNRQDEQGSRSSATCRLVAKLRKSWSWGTWLPWARARVWSWAGTRGIVEGQAGSGCCL